MRSALAFAAVVLTLQASSAQTPIIHYRPGYVRRPS
jgi:hypothetical protein